jgi:hypothetical protein
LFSFFDLNCDQVTQEKTLDANGGGAFLTQRSI